MPAGKHAGGPRPGSSSGMEPLMGERPTVETPKDYWWRKSRLCMYTFMLLVASVGNTVYFKRMTSAMPNYGWYLTQLSTVIYVPFFAVLAGVGVSLSVKSELVQKFGVMGICDGLSGTLMVLGGVHTSGTMQVLISQAVIPMTMAFTIVLVKKRYHPLQNVGAAIIVLGIVLAKVASSGSAGGGEDSLVFNVIFLLALVPSSLSSVFKEVAFRGYEGDLDVNMLQFWVAGFQVVVNFLAMPIYTLRLLGAQQVPIDQMAGLSVGGTRCLFFLEDQVLDNCGMLGQRPCDHCQDAWVPVLGYLAFNLLFNIFTMLVIKHGSATLSFLVATLRMPLSSLAFASPYIMGAEAVSPDAGDYISLVIILCGLFAYRYGARLLKRRLRGVPPPSPTDAGPASTLWPSPSEMFSGAGKGSRWRLAPLFTLGATPALPPAFVLVREPRFQPRSAERVRHDLYHRLGAASPLSSPRLRDRSPPGSPPMGAAASPDSPHSPQSPVSTGALPPACQQTGFERKVSQDGDIAIVGLPSHP